MTTVLGTRAQSIQVELTTDADFLCPLVTTDGSNWSPTLVATLRNSGGAAGRIQVNTNGAVAVYNTSNVLITATAAGAWVSGRWNRIEITMTVATSTTGSFTLNVYDEDSLTPTGTCTASNANFGTTNLVSMDLGSPGTNNGTVTHYFDTAITIS